MKDIPAPKIVLRALGIVCDACGKQFASSDGFDKHRTRGYLIGNPCHVLDDGSTRTHMVSSERATMSTAMLQKLKVDRRKHGTAGALLIMLMTITNCLVYLCLLMSSKPVPPVYGPPGFETNSAYGTYQTKYNL
jgi:hypothetical protein